MESPIDILNKKIETDKEILSVMPTNTKKNTELYIEKLQKIKEDYKRYQDDVILEIKRRANKLNLIEADSRIAKLEKKLEKMNQIDLFYEADTAYEKMNIDEVVFDLKRFYKNSLEQTNSSIEKSITIFKEKGINLKLDDFQYSPYVKRYMKKFFEELEKGDINSPELKEEFTNIYWECSDILIQIRLNIRHIYMQYRKTLEKYYENSINEMLKELKIDDKSLLEEYIIVEKELADIKSVDKRNILDKFLNKELNIKDFQKETIKKQYEKILERPIEEYSDDELKEISENTIKLSKSLEEYKKYTEYKFIITKALKIYEEKDKYKAVYEDRVKEIKSLETNLFKLNNKYNKIEGKKFFIGNKEEKLKSIALEINAQILNIRDLFKEVDTDKVKEKIATKITDNSTVFDILYIVCGFYSCMFKIIAEEYEELTEEEINEKIAEIQHFITGPDITIMKKINIKEDKDVVIMIKDMYKLFNIDISKSDFEDGNIDSLQATVDIIANAYYIEQSGLTIDDIEFFINANELLEKLQSRE